MTDIPPSFHSIQNQAPGAENQAIESPKARGKSFISSMLEKMSEKVNQFATHLAFGNQMAQIADRRAILSHQAQNISHMLAPLQLSKDQLEDKINSFNQKQKQIEEEYQEISAQIKQLEEKEKELDSRHELSQTPEENASILKKKKTNSKEKEELTSKRSELIRQFSSISDNKLNAFIGMQQIEDKIKNTKLQKTSAQLHTELLDSKEASLKEYIATLSFSSKIKLIFLQAAAKTSLIGSAIVRNLIHPATKELTYEAISAATPEALQKAKMEMKKPNATKEAEKAYNTLRYQEKVSEAMRAVEEDIQLGNAERINIFTSDHQQLDGCVIYGGPNKGENRPVLVMSQGNLMTYELSYETAKAYAKEYGVNVVLYNPRGIGHSLGKENTTGEAVTDCKAAIEYASQRFCPDNPQKLAVYGHSLGGGISATALKELIQEGALPKGGIGLYTNHHSFSSLQGFISGQANKNLFTIGSIALKLIGLNTLDAEQAVSKNRLASKVIVATGEQDDLMKGQGRLRDRLLSIFKSEEWQKKDVSFISLNAFGHNDEIEYASSDYRSNIQNSIEFMRDRQKTLETKLEQKNLDDFEKLELQSDLAQLRDRFQQLQTDLAHLNHYHAQFMEWATT
ncbi:alpha/beta hydrolase family protein [Candidatus Protochlamydia phocaeensis]|uniref:alpha/beta hydrolase family protein n=1 Tax=Candidatus Protochlamydia phocaeensis TaxID=1414722 RepID=UPI0008391043|nr:alpha/beta hydrolase [Candidatus Protochlamydia phocaeensis]